MTKSVNLQHRHFVLIAETIASLPLVDYAKAIVAEHFCRKLASTNPNFSADRFMACAMGNPTSGRDA